MSYAVPPAGAEARQRPASVSAAVWLMYLVAALFLVSGIIAIAVHGPMSEVFERAFADEPEGDRAASVAAVAGTGVRLAISVLFAAGLFVLAALNARGSNAARIITWVVAGIQVCCAGLSLVGTLVGNSMTGFGGGGQTDPAEIQRLMDELLPSWVEPVMVTLSVLQLLSMIAVAVLLALPASNAFFRRPPPAWEPPVPSYPPYPPVNPPPGG